MLNEGDTAAEVREGRFGWPWVASLRPSEPPPQPLSAE